MILLTSVSAVQVISPFRLNRTDSNFGLFAFGWDPSDPAAHVKHYIPDRGLVTTKTLNRMTRIEIKFGNKQNRNDFFTV